MKKKNLLPWSGGKDSALALQALKNDAACKLSALFPLWHRRTDHLIRQFNFCDVNVKT